MRRRGFLSGALGVALLPSPGRAAPDDAELLSWLSGTDGSAAERAFAGCCGQAGMTPVAAAAHWPVLRERIERRTAVLSPTEACAALSGIVREDFARSDCVSVAGWRLARSEVAVAVLTATGRRRWPAPTVG